MQPLVSIILPIFNGQNFLNDCLKSIFNQNYSNFELIIINDGSTDETENIIQNQLDERVIYLKNETNQGISKSLNAAINIARGDFILRMDSDDVMLRTKIEQQVTFLQTYTEISILGTRFEQMHNERPLFTNLPISDSDIKLFMFLRCPICHPTVMIRHSALKQSRLKYDETLITAEDYQLWANAFIAQLKFANLPDKLLQYRQHDSQNTDRHFNTLIQLDNSIRLHLARHFYNDIIEKYDEEIYLQFINLKFGSLSDFKSIHQLVKMLIKTKIHGIEIKSSRNFWLQTWSHYMYQYAYNYKFINYRISFILFKFYLGKASFYQPKDWKKRLRFVLVGLGLMK